MRVHGIPATVKDGEPAIHRHTTGKGSYSINFAELLPYLTRREQEELIAMMQKRIQEIYS